MGRPEIVRNSVRRSGAVRSAGASVSRSQRVLSVSAAAFIVGNYNLRELTRLVADTRRRP